MNKLLNGLYKKSELYFALMWIGIYCVVNSLAISLSEAVKVNSSVNLIFNIVLTFALFVWVTKNRLAKHYGLCRTDVPASRFLWYIPLIIFMSGNLWFGIAINLSALDTVCYILNMLCVGFLEEVIFRGFLFKALAKDNVKMAIIISSVTFGVGHIMNLFNGSGMDLLSNICQIVCAIACGFLFVIIFYRGGSLIPCIVAHSVNNALSAFANEASLVPQKRIVFSAIIFITVAVYAFILTKTLPKSPQEHN